MIFGEGLAQPLYRLTVTFIAMSPAVFSHIGSVQYVWTGTVYKNSAVRI